MPQSEYEIRAYKSQWHYDNLGFEILRRYIARKRTALLWAKHALRQYPIVKVTGHTRTGEPFDEVLRRDGA